jgi:hypothetical protein
VARSCVANLLSAGPAGSSEMLPAIVPVHKSSHDPPASVGMTERGENSLLTKNVSDGAEVSHSLQMTGEGGVIVN